MAPIKRLRKNFAFTLAEVLITLGIIGIVAAMVIPSLINAYQKHVTVTRLKQAYAQLTQAVKLSENENGDVTVWDMTDSTDLINSSKKFAQTYIVPFIKYNNSCENENDSCNKGYQVKYLSGANVTTVMNKLYGIVLINGVILRFRPRDTFIEIYIDINGTSKPNIVGKDIFYVILYNGDKQNTHLQFQKYSPGIFFWGEGADRETLMKTAHSSYLCSKTGSGIYCGALIKEDGWKISKDYPW